MVLFEMSHTQFRVHDLSPAGPKLRVETVKDRPIRVLIINYIIPRIRDIVLLV